MVALHPNRTLTSPQGDTNRNDGIRSSAMVIASARTSPAAPKVTTEASVRSAIDATEGLSAFSTATPSTGAIHEFALAEGDGLHAAELAGVRLSDGRDDADRRPSSPAEGGDVPDTAGTHFEHDRSTVVGSAEQGQGTPISLLNERRLACVVRSRRRTAARKIFRRRLADRSGDPDDGSVTETISGGGAERSESVVGGRHLDHDGVGGLDRLRREGRNRTGTDCGRHEVMTIAFGD